MLRLILLCVGLMILTLILYVKIRSMQYSIKEIRTQLKERLEQDTNTLITVSGRDPYVRKLAADLNCQLRELKEKRQKFQNGDLELKEAVTNISHDIRTPLTAICGYLDLLKQEEKSEAASRYLDIIENRADLLKQLSEELFRYSVITSAPGEMIREEISLAAALEEGVAAFYGAFRKKGITPSVSMPQKKVMCCLNRKAFLRIIENILSNALKYSAGDLTIILTESGEIIFSNTAEALDSVMTEQLFNRFYTVETGKDATGLGLSIAKQLTEQMGGTITAKYCEGRLFLKLRFAIRC